MTCSDAMNELPAHIPALLPRARRLCRNDADARDLIQDTCVNALEALADAAAPPENLLGWLVVIMRNLWFSIVRQRRVRADAHAEMATRPSLDDALCEARLVYNQLARAWSELPPQSQNIARRCLLDGDSQQEVSQTLGMTAGGVAASIHRTRHALRLSLLEATR